LHFSNEFLSAIPQLGVVLGIMVLVHEFGHFAAAKLCRVRVEAFAIGFGRKLFGFESGGTSYQLNLLPLGGYVKMAGELPGEETHSDDLGEFQNHPRWQRAIITLAGPFANFVLALGLMTGLYMLHHVVPDYKTNSVVADYVSPGSPMAKSGIAPGDKVVHIDTIENPTWQDVETRTAAFDFGRTTPFAYLHDGKRVETTLTVDGTMRQQDFDPDTDLGIVPMMQAVPVQVATVEPGLPAAAAGLKAKDIITAIDNRQVHSVAALVAYLKDQAGKPAVLTVSRAVSPSAVESLTIPVTPVYTDVRKGKGWRLGFEAVNPPTHVERLSLAGAFHESYEFCIENSKLIFEVLQRLFTRQMSVKSLSSPIGIGVEVHQAFAESDLSHPEAIIGTMAMISLNLGIFNLLPIPILDGGMILFLAIESLIRRDLNPRFKERVYQVAFVCIILFAAVVIFNDITKFLPISAKP
jgi:regulator of sigma E protease